MQSLWLKNNIIDAMNVAMENNRHIEIHNSENSENIEPNTKTTIHKQPVKNYVNNFIIIP